MNNKLIISQEEFEKKLKNEDKLVIDFFAEWCGACKLYAPIFAEVADKNKDIAMYKIDVDQHPDLAIHYDISSIPTTIIFKNGEIFKDKLIGYISKDDLEKKLSELRDSFSDSK